MCVLEEFVILSKKSLGQKKQDMLRSKKMNAMFLTDDQLLCIEIN
jgi:hypothetical protein